jgi:hypothetical protein
MAKLSNKCFFSNYWRFKIQKKNSATACSWFIFVFHPSEKVCHSKENMMMELVL